MSDERCDESMIMTANQKCLRSVNPLHLILVIKKEVAYIMLLNAHKEKIM